MSFDVVFLSHPVTRLAALKLRFDNVASLGMTPLWIGHVWPAEALHYIWAVYYTDSWVVWSG